MRLVQLLAAFIAPPGGSAIMTAIISQSCQSCKQASKQACMHACMHIHLRALLGCSRKRRFSSRVLLANLRISANAGDGNSIPPSRIGSGGQLWALLLHPAPEWRMTGINVGPAEPHPPGQGTAGGRSSCCGGIWVRGVVCAPGVVPACPSGGGGGMANWAGAVTGRFPKTLPGRPGGCTGSPPDGCWMPCSRATSSNVGVA
jgi:hypothetical protein